MMAQSVARFGRITNVPSAATDRQVEVPAPATVETSVSDAAWDSLLVVMAEPARPHLHLPDRRSLGGPGAGGRSTPPRHRRARHPVLAGRLAAQDDPPGAPVEVVQLQPRRLAVIAFGTLASWPSGGITYLARVPEHRAPIPVAATYERRGSRNQRRTISRSQ
jgi:hypothetical protein